MQKQFFALNCDLLSTRQDRPSKLLEHEPLATECAI